MNPWWWVPIGLAAWFAVAVIAALPAGWYLKHCSRARERPGSSDEGRQQ